MFDNFALAESLKQKGVPFVIATVVRAESPTSAKAGDKALVTSDGVIEGWVGGSCAEPTVLDEARAALEDGECRLIHISPEAELPAIRQGLRFFPMTCYSGGTLEIYLEPHLAAPNLVIFGSSPVAEALAELGRVMKYRVTVVDLTDRPPMRGGHVVVRNLAELSVGAAPVHVVVSTHGVFDEESLQHALSLKPAYLALVASRRRASAVKATLASMGVEAAELETIRAPAGVDLGGVAPEEIALSIMAEVVRVRRKKAATHAAALLPETHKAGEPKPRPSLAIAKPSCCAHKEEPVAASEKNAAGEVNEAHEAPALEAHGAHEAPAIEVHEAHEAPALEAREVHEAPAIEAILLAAGESTRMGQNKLLLPVGGRPLVRRSAETLLAAGFKRVIAVLGFEAEKIRAALEGLDLEIVINERFHDGQATSARAGIEAVSHDAAGVLISLADQPELEPADLQEIKDAFLARGSGSVLVPMYQGQRGNPIVLDRHGLDTILSRGGNFACRHFTTHHADLVVPHEMKNDHVVRDLDVPEDYAKLTSAAR